LNSLQLYTHRILIFAWNSNSPQKCRKRSDIIKHYYCGSEVKIYAFIFTCCLKAFIMCSISNVNQMGN
jgi:hypothetical protein